MLRLLRSLRMRLSDEQHPKTLYSRRFVVLIMGPTLPEAYG